MTDSQMDEIFKKQLSGHESVVPEDMWERIIQKKDKDRRGFFFFFTLSGLFLLGFGIAGILLFHLNRKDSPINERNTYPNNAGSKSNVVKTARTDQQTKIKTTHHHVALFRGLDTLLHSAQNNNYLKGKKYTGKKSSTSLAGSLKKHNLSSGSGDAESKNDEAAAVVRSEDAVDTGKIAETKLMPVLSASPKPMTKDSLKTVALKKTDSTKKNLSKWSVDLYVSPDYPIGHRREYITGQLSYTAGLKLNRSFGKRFSGKIGIQFSQLNYILPDSSTSPGSHYLKRVDVPMLAGYSWGNEALGMTVNAGVIFNLYSWLGQNQFNYIKANTGLSFYVGFNFSKQIKERLDIFSEPYYRYQLTSMVSNPNYFPKYIDVVGISFGVRYHLKK
jgi:hypothetical protein